MQEDSSKLWIKDRNTLPYGGARTTIHKGKVSAGAKSVIKECPTRGWAFFENGVPKGIRTPVAAVKGQCPRPLDDGDEGL